MLVEVDGESGAVSLDAAGWEALLAAHRGAETAHPDAVLAVASGRLDPALDAVAAPAATASWVVAGPQVRLEHRAWVDQRTAALLLGVRDDRYRLLASHPAFLTAALVRTTRLRPHRQQQETPTPFPSDRLPELVAADPELRRRALTDAGAGFAWHLVGDGPAGQGALTATAGDAGVCLADTEQGLLRPASNTTVYRLLSTLLLALTEAAG